jgi:hypothetical protein
MTITAQHGSNARSSLHRGSAASRAIKADQRATAQARTEALEAHRDEIEGRGRVRTVSLPTGSVRIRPTGHCPFCAGAAFRVEYPILDLARPRAQDRGSIICLLCARTCVVLVIGGAP